MKRKPPVNKPTGKSNRPAVRVTSGNRATNYITMSVKEQYWRYSLVVIILGLGAIIFVKLLPFLGGLLGALTIYILVRKQMFSLTEKRHIRRGLAAAIVLCESILCFLIPMSLVVWLVVNKLQGINLDPGSIIEPAKHIAQLVEEKTGYDLLVTDNLVKLAAWIPKIGQLLMEWISGFTVNIFVLIFVLYFMLIGGRKMEDYLDDILPFNKVHTQEVLHEIKMIVQSNAIGIPLLALIQGFVALVGYWIFGVPSAVLFGLLTCFATIIPIVGTMLIWVPIVIYLALSGSWGNAIGLAIYASIVVSQSDNLIRFVLQKKMADTHPLITIFGVVIGLSLFGFMGVIFGPLMLAIFILCVNMFKREYLDGKRTAKNSSAHAESPDRQ